MSKRIIDLTATELSGIADEAWTHAAREALAKGLPVTGSRDGRRIKYFPDGHIEDLGPVSEIENDGVIADATKNTGRSVA